jgi:hypothetical protein
VVALEEGSLPIDHSQSHSSDTSQEKWDSELLAVSGGIYHIIKHHTERMLQAADSEASCSTGHMLIQSEQRTPSPGRSAGNNRYKSVDMRICVSPASGWREGGWLLEPARNKQSGGGGVS